MSPFGLKQFYRFFALNGVSSFIDALFAVMSFPAEGVESAIKNHIDDVRAFLDARHPNSYAVYNLSQRSYRVAKFQNRVSFHAITPTVALLLLQMTLPCPSKNNTPPLFCVLHRSQNVAGHKGRPLLFKTCLLFVKICTSG